LSVWAVVASALFGLYPLHQEAVAWITGRVDSIVTFFCLGSFYGYLRWRRPGSGGGLGVVLVFIILRLLFQEKAGIIAAMFLCWEIFEPTQRAMRGIARTNVETAERGAVPMNLTILTTAISRLKPTLVFWAVLAGYFVVRRLALGTFVGGYDDSLFFISNWK